MSMTTKYKLDGDFDSNDELMLKELERRDGIYSFIFHELDTRQSPRVATPQVIPESSTTAVGFGGKLDAVRGTNYSGGMFATTAAHVGTANLCNLSNGMYVNTAIARPNYGYNNAASVCTYGQQQTSYQDYMRMWRPVPPVPQPLIAFGSGQPYTWQCGFQVRVPPPPFTDANVPLVRNRRHALKDTEEYLRANEAPQQRPDLRQLFPCDPDVFAPFRELAHVVVYAQQQAQLQTPANSFWAVNLEAQCQADMEMQHQANLQQQAAQQKHIEMAKLATQAQQGQTEHQKRLQFQQELNKQYQQAQIQQAEYLRQRDIQRQELEHQQELKRQEAQRQQEIQPQELKRQQDINKQAELQRQDAQKRQDELQRQHELQHQVKTKQVALQHQKKWHMQLEFQRQLELQQQEDEKQADEMQKQAESNRPRKRTQSRKKGHKRSHKQKARKKSAPEAEQQEEAPVRKQIKLPPIEEFKNFREQYIFDKILN